MSRMVSYEDFHQNHRKILPAEMPDRVLNVWSFLKNCIGKVGYHVMNVYYFRQFNCLCVGVILGADQDYHALSV